MGTFWEHLPKKKKPKHLIYRYLDFFLVPRPGVEPGWMLLHWCLRPARLPIPPSGHHFRLRVQRYTYFSIVQGIRTKKLKKSFLTLFRILFERFLQNKPYLSIKL